MAVAAALWRIDQQPEPLLALLHDTWFKDGFISNEELFWGLFGSKASLMSEERKRQAVLAIANALHSGDVRVRRMAALALSAGCFFSDKMASHIRKLAEPAIPDLIRLINEIDPLVQVLSVSALGSMGPAAKAAVPVLREEMQKRRPRCCCAIAAMIGSPLRQPIFRALLAQRMGWDAWFIEVAEKAVTKIDGGKPTQ
jgi:hypothetical protein